MHKLVNPHSFDSLCTPDCPECKKPDSLPAELQNTLELFTRVATKHGFMFAGMMIRARLSREEAESGNVIDMPKSPLVVAMGNVNERGHEFAELLRKFASIMDEAAAQGIITDNRINKPM